MHWLLLSMGIVLEVCGTTCLKLSDGFSKLVPSILLFAFYGLFFAAIDFVVKRMDLSIAYAIWAALGITLVSIIGIIHFKEPVSLMKITSMALIVIEVVRLTSQRRNSRMIGLPDCKSAKM